MHNELIISFLCGGTSIAAVGIALFFYRCWKETKDRLFPFLAAAFFVIGASQWLAVFASDTAQAPALYWIRLFAFILIIIAVIEKNLQKKS
ncbi:MAG: hypothetical protein K2W95_04205 [Candidatus Obscuribacterales bacterium]|nr:hypothetical protein [Candidatus Obscuribacterales bacterium]